MGLCELLISISAGSQCLPERIHTIAFVTKAGRLNDKILLMVYFSATTVLYHIKSSDVVALFIPITIGRFQHCCWPQPCP